MKGAEPVARRLIIRGRVQGVGFRQWTRTVAREHGVRGWVRNLQDGTVEALLAGSPEKVSRVEELCRSGPPGAQVASIDSEESADSPEMSGFSVRVD